MTVRDSRKSAEELAEALASLRGMDLAATREELEAPTKPFDVFAEAKARDLFRWHVEILLLRYSMGEDVAVLAPLYPDLVSLWELKLSVDRGALNDVQLRAAHDYSIQRDLYQWACWMVSLGILFEASDDVFDRVVASSAGVNDRVLDRLIATRVPSHPISETVLWPRPFALLEAALAAPVDQRPPLMLKFVKGWYGQSRKVYWWSRHTLNPIVAAKYFGYWCVEAAAAVTAFGIDNSALVGNEYYPADLVPARWKK